MRRSVLRLALALLALSGCRGCRNEHPFVPYRIEAGTDLPPGDKPDAAAPSDAQSPAPFTRQPGVVAPTLSTHWVLGTMTLDAPSGGTFQQGLVWDIDGDGYDDALTIVEDAEGQARESLFFYRGTKEGSAVPQRVPLVAASAEPPLDPRGCKRVERMTRVGKRSLAVEIGEECSKDMASAGADRTVALVAWSGSMRTRLGFTVIDPPDAPALTFDFDGADVDGDGLDDVTLRVSLEGGGAPFEPMPPVHALFRWFDRTAGMSREPGEPEKSFHAIAALAAQRALRTKEAASAVALAAAGRFLFQAICAESPARRAAPPLAGEPLVCDSAHALEELGLAETHAYVTGGDVLRAIASLDATEEAPASKSPARVAEADGWITTLAPVVQPTAVRAIGAVPLGDPTARLGAVEWGALRFDGTGNVLVRTPAGVVRVDPVHGDEVDAKDMQAWSALVMSPDAKTRFVWGFVPCQSAELEGFFTTPAGGNEPSVLLPIPRPIAAGCAFGGEGFPVPTMAAAWGPGGLEAIVAGEPVLIAPDNKASPLLQLLDQPVTPGAPRSPDGKLLVVPTSRGIVVRGEKTRLLRAKELDHGYGELRDCAVSNDGSRVACVRGGAAFVGVWPLP